MNPKSYFRSLLRASGYDAVDVRRFDRAMGAELSWPTHERLLAYLMDNVLETAGEHRLFFLQIGANDGVKDNFTGRVLERRDVRIVLVEPDESCAQQLALRFKTEHNVAVVQKALASHAGEQCFFFFDRAEEKGIQLNVFSSFDRQLLEEKKAVFGLVATIASKPVACTTLQDISRDFGVRRWDVIVADIEGFDHEVVRQVCSGAQENLPRLFVFEHSWLSPAVREECYRSLAKRGYAIVAGAHDTIALLAD